MHTNFVDLKRSKLQQINSNNRHMTIGHFVRRLDFCSCLLWAWIKSSSHDSEHSDRPYQQNTLELNRSCICIDLKYKYKFYSKWVSLVRKVLNLSKTRTRSSIQYKRNSDWERLDWKRKWNYSYNNCIKVGD